MNYQMHEFGHQFLYTPAVFALSSKRPASKTCTSISPAKATTLR